MKRHVANSIIALFCIIVGVLIRDIVKLLSIVLIFIGIALLLVTFISLGKTYADKCPRCGTVLYRGPRMYREKRDGIIRCPRCESLIRIESVKNGKR